MATFKPDVQKIRKDGTYPVYIRCTHNRRNAYMKTDMYIHANKVKNGNITDHNIIGKCAIKINEYIKKLNFENTENWSVQEVIDFITTDSTTIPFAPFCQSFIDKMVNEGRGKSASNYKCAIKSFSDYFGQSISFQDINSKGLTDWIKSLNGTKRAKETYPKHIKAMFDAGCLEYNDYNRNIIRIPSRPFMGVKIPKHDRPQLRAIEATEVKAILEYNALTRQTQKAKDVAKLMFYFVGMNTVDLFNLKKTDLVNGEICYERSKTKDSRDDNAYIKVAVHSDILDLIEKYKGEDRLFDFGYSNDRSFNKHINIGLKAICKALKIPPVDTYTFRHSWATIAQNDCGANTPLIAFCLNHGSAHKVTEGYIKKDFSPIDILNKQVIDFVLGKTGGVKMGEKRTREKKGKVKEKEVKVAC